MIAMSTFNDHGLADVTSPAIVRIPSNSSSLPEIGQTRWRWLMIFLYALQTIMNAVLWITFAPVTSAAATYFDTNTTVINMLSLMFMIVYLPGSIFAAWIFNRYGLRTGMFVGSFCNLLSAGVRYLAIGSNHRARSAGLAIIVIGQFIGGMAQPFFTNSPAKLAGEWFPTDERNVATTIAAMCNPLGIALGQVLPTIGLVDTATSDFESLLLVQLISAGGVALLTFMFFRPEPELAPSLAALERRQANEKTRLHLQAARQNRLEQNNGQDGWCAWLYEMPEFHDIGKVMADREFCKLLFGFGLGLGLFNGMSTVIQQLVEPTGYNSDDAGLFGALIIGGGLLGAMIAGPALDYTHAYKPIMKICCAVAAAGTIFFVVVLKPGQSALVTAAFGVLGLAMMPLLPVCFESAVECTYPVNEETSSGLLMLAGNWFGIGIVFLLGYLITLRPTYTSIFNPASIFIFVTVLICVSTLCWFDGHYHRKTFEEGRRDTGTAAEALMNNAPN